MANAINTLFPPVVSTFMPAIKEGESVKVYFSYSPFIKRNDSKAVQVSVVNQKNNQNALVDTTGVLFFASEEATGNDYRKVQYDKDQQCFYIELDPTDFLNETLIPEQYYKVQLRLDSSDLALPFCKKDSEGNKSDYLIEAIRNGTLSEWSSVCLIRSIYSPTITLNLFTDPQGEKNEKSPSFYEGIVPLAGTIFYSNDKSSEKIQSFSIEVFTSLGVNVFTSEQVFPEKENEFLYYLSTQDFDLNSKAVGDYVLKITIITNNLYQFSEEFNFTISESHDVDSGYNPFDPETGSTDIKVNLNQAEGIAYFRVMNIGSLGGTFYVKRSSHKTNFTKWETIKEIDVSKLPGSELNVKIEDNTISPLTWYKYSYQYKNPNGVYLPVKMTQVFFADFEYSSLIRQDRQLNLLYNCSISNYKNTVSRTKTDTLGGKYPRFTENAILNYKQFSLSGTISAESDFNQKFLNKEDYFKDAYSYYTAGYLTDKNIASFIRNDLDPGDIGSSSNITTTTANDWLWEREFREEVVSWLNNGEPKLFRSITEGAIPVILTDVSLTPKTQLGRMLYDFSATAYQVGDGDSIKDLIQLGIFAFEKVEEQILDEEETPGESEDYTTIERPGQLFGFSLDQLRAEGSLNLVDFILEKVYEKNNLIQENNEDRFLQIEKPSERFNAKIKNIKVFFESLPHVYFFDEINYPDGTHWKKGLYDAQGNSIQPTSPKELVYTPMGNIRYPLGTLKQGYQLKFNINSEQIETASENDQFSTVISKHFPVFVNKQGYYQLPSNINVTEMYLSQEEGILDKVTIEYVVSYDQTLSSSIDKIQGIGVNRTIVGQARGVFQPGENLGASIRKKYSFHTKNQQQQMKFWKGLSLEASPYSVFSVKYVEGDENFYTYVIGKTGVFHLIKEYEVQDLQFKGRRMFKLLTGNTEGYLTNLYSIKEYEFYFAPEGNYVSNTTNPKRNCVYETEEGSEVYQIFCLNNWYDFEFEENSKEVGLAKIPVEAIIDYYGDVVQVTWESTETE